MFLAGRGIGLEALGASAPHLIDRQPRHLADDVPHGDLGEVAAVAEEVGATQEADEVLDLEGVAVHEEGPQERHQAAGLVEETHVGGHARPAVVGLEDHDQARVPGLGESRNPGGEKRRRQVMVAKPRLDFHDLHFDSSLAWFALTEEKMKSSGISGIGRGFTGSEFHISYPPNPSLSRKSVNSSLSNSQSGTTLPFVRVD
jgi:hypothetical protein